MASLGLSFLFMLVGTTSGQTSYNYNQCDLVSGPFAWASPCNPLQLQGTPINLCNGTAFPSYYTPSLSVTGYTTARTMNILNNGHTIQVNVVGTAPTLQAGNLSAIVGRGNSSTPTWTLGQMHLHWGRLNKTNEGSEHYIQGTPYALEAHFVHYNPARGSSVGAAVGTGALDALLVVGVMFQVGGTDVPSMLTIVQNTANATQTPKAMPQQVTLSDTFDGTGEYYSYGGSLTTPTCNQQVTWIVMKTPKSITQATLDLLKNTAVENPPAALASKFDVQSGSGARAGTGLIAVYGNFRPLQLLAGRTVYSSNGATAACGTVVQPNFGCSAAFMASPSVLTPLAVLLSMFLMVWRE